MGNSASRGAAAAPPASPEPVSPPPPPEEEEGVSSSSSGPSACPVPKELRGSSPIFNVYSQRIDGSYGSSPSSSFPRPEVLDPTNNMPLQPNQLPAPGQSKLLSTHRQESTIPKSGTEGTWTYPSPQMFFNALRRKGKGADVSEDDMDAVILAHNTMNEATWRQVALWESLHRAECPNPSLLRFQGRPDDLSPLARLTALFGGPVPFDRHDWFVDRCGVQVRYVIDFYFDDAKAGTPEAFTLRVRPALDSPTAALDRVKMTIYEKFAQWGLPCPVTGSKGEIGAKAAGKE